MAQRTLGAPRRSQIDVMRKASTRTHVYNVLRQAIVTLKLTPGQALSENELAAEYAVSRTPVREALIRLADDGLVEVVPQLGTFVSRIDPQQVKEVHFIRLTLESASLPHAIKRMQPRDERKLERILAEQLDAEEDGDIERWFETDEDLHRTLLEIGGHKRAWPVVSASKAHLDRVYMLTLPDPAKLSDLHAQHRAIVDQVVSKQRRQSEKELREHLHLPIDVLPDLEKKHPDYFLPDED